MAPGAIFLPYLAHGHDFAAPAGVGDPSNSAGRRLLPASLDSQPARPHQATATATVTAGAPAYAIVWRKLPDGSVKAEIVAEDGTVVADPASLGIAVPTVAPRFTGGQEPEGWVQRGSVIVCINVDQYKGCITVDD